MNPADFVGFTFHTPRFENEPAWVSFRRVDQIHIDVLWDAIDKILQSNAEIFSDGQFTMELTQVSMPRGNGKPLKGHGLSYAELCRRDHGIIEVNNTDDLCLPRALVIAEAFVQKDPHFKNIRKDHNIIQRERVRAARL